MRALSGQPSKQFRLAVKNFQRSAGLKVTGELLMPDEYRCRAVPPIVRHGKYREKIPQYSVVRTVTVLSLLPQPIGLLA